MKNQPLSYLYLLLISIVVTITSAFGQAIEENTLLKDPYISFPDLNKVELNIENVPPAGGDNDDVPIDGGLSLLLAAGAGYGANKLRKNKKKK